MDLNMTERINNDFHENNFETVTQVRHKILQLEKAVKDSPKLIEAAIVLCDIQKKKENVSLDQLSFIPAHLKAFFEKRAINGILSFDDYTAAGQEMINYPRGAN